MERYDELRSLVLDAAAGQRVGYLTDLRCTEANVQALSRLLAGVELLFIESVFLDDDAEHAARKDHLTAGSAGTIAQVRAARGGKRRQSGTR